MKKESRESAKKKWEAYRKERRKVKVDRATAHFKFGIRDRETEEQFMKRNASPITFAVLKDGQWYEQGEMCWWGMVAKEKDPEKWVQEWNKLVMSLPDDTLLTVVDCHI